MNMPQDLPTAFRWPAKTNHVPKEIFDRPDIYQLELERFFYGPEWHPVATVSEVPKPGDFKTFNLAEVPLLVVHGEDGQVRVFYNACTHRGTLLETKFCGHRTEFECPYHRWLFDSTGALRGAPGTDEFSPSFRMEDFGLQQLRSEIFAGLVFVTMSDHTPALEPWLGRIAPAVDMALSGGRLDLLGYQKVVYDTNWKAYVDNDGYHPPLLHSAFKLLGWQGGVGKQYGTENGHMVIEAELKVPKDNGFLNDPSLIEFRGRDTTGSMALVINPITVITRHLDMINVRLAFPRAVNKTEVHYLYFSQQGDDEEMARHRLRQSANMLGPCGMVSMEDAATFHRIHIGNHTPGNAIFQKGVHDEHSIWYDFKQNDESGNLPRWEYYRQVMGFERG